jgi:hypothetical protein
MLDNTEGSGEGKQRVTPRPEEPIPLCTVMSDGSIKVQSPQTPLVDLNRTLLYASATLTERTVQRAAAMEQVIVSVQRRFDGFDDQTTHAMAAVLGQVPAPESGG